MNNRRRLFLLLVGGVLLISSATGLIIWQAVQNPGAVPVPNEIVDLPRLETLSGPPAAANIGRLHRQTFALSGAAVGAYGAGPHSATLWVSESPLGLFAAGMEADMEQQIATGESPFTPVGTRQVCGRTIHSLTGMGQQHYYFRSGKRIVWLAVDQALGEAALAEIQTFYSQEKRDD